MKSLNLWSFDFNPLYLLSCLHAARLSVCLPASLFHITSLFSCFILPFYSSVSSFLSSCLSKFLSCLAITCSASLFAYLLPVSRSYLSCRPFATYYISWYTDSPQKFLYIKNINKSHLSGVIKM